MKDNQVGSAAAQKTATNYVVIGNEKIRIEDFHELITHVTPAKTDTGHDCQVCQNTLEAVRRGVNWMMKAQGWEGV